MAFGNKKIVAAKDQVFCELAGEAVILNLKSWMCYGLDAVGLRICNLNCSRSRPRRG